jgi:molybdenum cofactor cytidylyltransferase
MIYGILLAAGKSSRFGEDKLTYLLTNKNSITEQSARTLLSALENTLVVVNNKNKKLSLQLEQLKIKTITCDNADNGMSASIACAIKATAHADGWIIALADMPFIQTETIEKLSAALKKGNDIVAPFYKNKRGNPIGFSHKHIDDLLTLSGDKGARDFLKQYESSIYKVPVDDAGILKDIDKKEDLL